MKALSLLAIGAAMLVPASIQAQTVHTFTGPTANNIDMKYIQDYSFNVDASGLIESLAFGITTNAVYADDVTFSLSHLGTTVTFYNEHGDTAGSQIDALFTDASTDQAPSNGSAIGTFAPANSFSAFKGLAAGGTYTLSTIDKIVANDHTSLTSSSLQLTTSAVPEPVSWAMMILGVGMIGGVMRRRIGDSEVKFDARIMRIAAGDAVA